MKILAINWEDLANPQAGGAEVHLQEILKRIARKGHEITLLCSSFPGAKETEESDGIRIKRCGSRYNFNLVAPFAFKALLKEKKWDIVIEDINKIPFYTPLYHGLPLLVVIPHLFSDTVFKEINFILGLYIYLSEKPIRTIYKGFKFMVISESTKEDLVKRKIPKDDIFVIKCGIDQALYRVDPQIKKDTSPTVIYLGRLKKYKSIDHLISGFYLILDKIPEARLTIVGDGDYKGDLMAFARKLGLGNRVEFTGYVDKYEKVKRLQKAWVAVYPSLKEGWGLTNIEANACGTPVIASNVPGLKDSVIGGKTGLLFEYGNVQELSRCMIRILSDREYRENLIRGGISWARSFSWDEAANKTLELMEEVIKEGARGNGCVEKVFL
ncbi:MAG: glycosyltransferase family 4 protein [candidate division Zixibacteria bacterium]|nr:glycosyltransferase family 4 protein [candidate division Zixibacteria bacterium]